MMTNGQKIYINPAQSFLSLQTPLRLQRRRSKTWKKFVNFFPSTFFFFHRLKWSKVCSSLGAHFSVTPRVHIKMQSYMHQREKNGQILNQWTKTLVIRYAKPVLFSSVAFTVYACLRKRVPVDLIASNAPKCLRRGKW